MAWIETVPEDNAKGNVREQYEDAKKRAGWVWNVIKVSSLRPELMYASMAVYLATFHKPSGLTRAQKEMIATLVSKLNNCNYCTQAHAFDLQHEGKLELHNVESFQQDYKKAVSDEKTRAILEFSEKMTLTPSKMSEEDIKGLREAGLADKDILETVHIAAFFNYINRIVDSLGVDLEDFMTPREA
jgi:uncharacterized peroxidase-related enzyme